MYDIGFWTANIWNYNLTKQNDYLSNQDTYKIYFILQTHLNSLHQYETKLHIVKVGNPVDVEIFAMPQTRFMAVTAYQNEEVYLTECGCSVVKRGFGV